MKKVLTIVFYVLISTQFALSQEEGQDEIDVNSINAPATPAATLLGFSASEIDKPKDASAFLGSIVTQTDGLKNIPSNYAFEIAPAWLLDGLRKKITFESFKSKSDICQGITLSGAVRRNEASDDRPNPMTQVAWGIKISLWRGGFSDATNNLIESAKGNLKTIHQGLASIIENDQEYQGLLDSIFDMPDSIRNKYPEQETILKLKLENQARILAASEADTKAETYKKLKADLNENKFTRKGFKLDLTAGFVQDFPNDNYSDRFISKYGAWVTSGYETEKGLSLLGIGRLLKCPDTEYVIDTFNKKGIVLSTDYGCRLIYSPSTKPWSISAEALHRQLKAKEEIKDKWETLDPTWRYSVTLEYQINKDLSLNFTFGKNFDGTANRKGNVISLLTLLKSLGNKKPIEKA